MEFRLLGPVEAWVDGRQVDLGVRQQRFVLVVLLLEVNKLVPVPRLIDLIWPDNPPTSARGVIHTHVSRLRTALAEARAAEYGVSLSRNGSCYVLRCDPMRVDAHRFRATLAKARTCTNDAERVDLLNEALAMWHGPALGSDDIRNRLCQSLNEARLAALEERFEAELRLGRHHALVDELTLLVGEYPNRQHLAAQLMLALHRSQRTEDALEVYDQIKRQLADTTGLDPATELAELHLAILRDDPDLRHPINAARASPATSAPVAVPKQLPIDAAGFTGREEYLRQLDDLVADPSNDAVVVVAIDGPAGVGKTALAVRWAHRVAPRFCDGQLFVSLRGYDPGPAMSGTEALAQFLRALGVPPEAIPSTESERSGMYRSLLADRRMLVVLDNAANVRQVRPLLPGSHSCLVLITSRDRLGGLVAREGAHRLTLGVLTATESSALLARLLGQRAMQEPDAVAELVGCCAHLPLACVLQQRTSSTIRIRP